MNITKSSIDENDKFRYFHNTTTHFHLPFSHNGNNIACSYRRNGNLPETRQQNHFFDGIGLKDIID